MRRAFLNVLFALLVGTGMAGEAFAERAAVIFIEMEHEDADEQALEEALNDYSTVDAYIPGHGGMQYLRGHFDDRFCVDDIPGMKGMDNIRHLRFVHIGSCHSWDLTDEFAEAGAKSSIGSNTKMSNFPFYPDFLYYFATLGSPLDTSVRLSQTPLIDDFRIRGSKGIRLKSE